MKRAPSRRFDGLAAETFAQLFAAVAEEMGATLRRSAFSVNVKERRDYSCALFDRSGQLLAQAAHLPVHLGSAPLSVRAVLERYGPRGLERGDAVLLNDPFAGGTHLPDLTLVHPVFLKGSAEPAFFVASRAHHADVGGPHPGSMGPAVDVHGEGLRIPPVKWVRAGVVQEELLQLLLANVRGPLEREGDLLAQWAAGRLGVRRLEEMAEEYGAQVLAERARDQLEWSAREARRMLETWPRGTYTVEAELEPGSAVLRATLTFQGPALSVDVSASDDQLPAPLNCPRAVTLSALLYVLRLFTSPRVPTNEGLLFPVKLRTRPASVLDARYPAAVAAGNVETSQRLVDLLLAGFAAADPSRVPAQSAGTMSNLGFGVARADASVATYYETLGGGAGAGPGGPGAHGVQTHMTNTRNTPIEAFEREYPVRVLALGLRGRGGEPSGGAGARPGGEGMRKELQFLAPARLGWLATRQARGPAGLGGGGEGRPGSLRVARAGGPFGPPLGGSAALELGPGDRIRIESPGGGGHGRARAPRTSAEGRSKRGPGRSA